MCVNVVSCNDVVMEGNEVLMMWMWDVNIV